LQKQVWLVISREEKDYILSHAYIPEHSVNLLTGVSGGEPFLIDDYLCCRRDDWIIVVGYPLARDFEVDAFERSFERIKNALLPRYASVMAPEMPSALRNDCQKMESDVFYILNMEDLHLKGNLKRAVKKASGLLRVERSGTFLESHHKLMQEFLDRVQPEERVERLLLKMPEYVRAAEHARVLNAWTHDGRLAAFYVVDLEPRHFATYIIGCHSRETYVSGASDLLLFETLQISRELGKNQLHLGFGVNPGISRFKKKWGGVPHQKYEMCDLVLKKASILETFFELCKKRT
jgi:hypothetical protein